MLNIAEKLGFMNARTAEVCTKIGILSCTSQKSDLSYEFVGKLPHKLKILIVQADFCKIIGIVRRKVCFLIV